MTDSRGQGPGVGTRNGGVGVNRIYEILSMLNNVIGIAGPVRVGLAKENLYVQAKTEIITYGNRYSYITGLNCLLSIQSCFERTIYKIPFRMNNRERGSHARGVYPTQGTLYVGTVRVK